MQFTLFFILVVELLNTSIEKTIDSFGLPKNELARHAKDIGSAAVFISFIFAGIVLVCSNYINFLYGYKKQNI